MRKRAMTWFWAMAAVLALGWLGVLAWRPLASDRGSDRAVWWTEGAVSGATDGAERTLVYAGAAGPTGAVAVPDAGYVRRTYP